MNQYVFDIVGICLVVLLAAVTLMVTVLAVSDIARGMLAPSKRVAVLEAKLRERGKDADRLLSKYREAADRVCELAETVESLRKVNNRLSDDAAKDTNAILNLNCQVSAMKEKCDRLDAYDKARDELHRRFRAIRDDYEYWWRDLVNTLEDDE